jgi:hypothetical protein
VTGRRRTPLFLGPVPITRGRRLGQDGGGHLVGKATEVVVDLDFKAGEAGGVFGQSVEPSLLHGIDLLAQPRRDFGQRGSEGAGLGSGAALHGRLNGAGGRTGRRLCYRGPQTIATFRESTPLHLLS